MLEDFDHGKYAFDRMMFPFSFRGHDIQLLHNYLEVKEDNRLFIHLNLFCVKCENSSSVRARLPVECNDYNYRAALAKFVAIGGFRNPCDK